MKTGGRTGVSCNPAFVSTTATPAVPLRITVPHVFGAQSSPQGLIISANPGFAYRNWTFTDDGTDIRPFQFGDYLSLTGVTPGTGLQNNQAGGPEYGYYDASTNRSAQRGTRGNDVLQRSVFFDVKYEFSDRFRVNLQSMNGRSESSFYNQPSNMTIPGALYAWTIYRANPYLPAQLAAEMDRLALPSIQITSAGIIDRPGRINIYDNRGDRSVGELESHTLSFDFDVTEKWSLGFDYQRAESTVATGILNVPRIDKFFLAMDAVRHPTTGQIVCNIAVRNPTPADLATFMQGILLPSPLDPRRARHLADRPVEPAGVQAVQSVWPWQRESGRQGLDRGPREDAIPRARAGLRGGAGHGRRVRGLGRRPAVDRRRPDLARRAVHAGQLPGLWRARRAERADSRHSRHPNGLRERRQPLAASVLRDRRRQRREERVGVVQRAEHADLGVRLGRRVGSTLGFRRSDYKRAGVQDSWKIGLDAQVFDTLRWRVTKSSDIREPNFAEVFLTGTGGGMVVDKFRGNEQNNALTILATSNPTLGAESADTLTTGFVWEPQFANWIDGLQLSLDWYDINLDGAVAPYGAQRIVDDCFATGAASACDLIQRAPPAAGQSIGTISRILNQNINADTAQTRGVDLEFLWGFEPDFAGNRDESFNIRGLFGRLHENSTTTAAGTTRDEAGSQTRPVYSGIVSGTYNLGKWGLMLQGDYYHHVMNNITWVEGVDVDDNWVASQSTLSFAASYRGESANGMAWRAAFNITNLTDVEPSIVANSTGQTLVMGHDTLGRRYQVSVNVDF